MTLAYTPLVQDYEAAQGGLKGLARSMSRGRTEDATKDRRKS